MSKIISITTRVPSFKHKQAELFKFAEKVYCKDESECRKLRFLYRQSGIESRYSIIPDYSVDKSSRIFFPETDDLEPFPPLEKRMKLYEEHATALSLQAIEDCIRNRIRKEEITHLITVSCTGMSAPGLDLQIMDALGLDRHITRTSVNFMGCYAAVHALKIADAFCRNDKQASVIIVCTEFCTLHFQKGISEDNITSSLIFADGCAAMLVQSGDSPNRGIRIRNFFSDVSSKGKKDMTWQLSSTGFLMTLTGYVPDLIKEDFKSLVEKALQHSGYNTGDISHWCIHPGGKKILESISLSTGITDEALRHSYGVLKDYGNMSSPTILFVLKRIMDELERNKPSEPPLIFGAAFGPGLTMETFTATYD